MKRRALRGKHPARWNNPERTSRSSILSVRRHRVYTPIGGFELGNSNVRLRRTNDGAAPAALSTSNRSQQHRRPLSRLQDPSTVNCRNSNRCASRPSRIETRAQPWPPSSPRARPKISQDNAHSRRSSASGKVGSQGAPPGVRREHIEALHERFMRAIEEVGAEPLEDTYYALVRVLVMLAIEERGPRYAVRQFPALLADNVRFEVQRQLRVKGEDQPVH